MTGKYTNDYRMVAGKKFPGNTSLTLEKELVSKEECAHECSDGGPDCGSFEYCELYSETGDKLIRRTCKFTNTRYVPTKGLGLKSSDFLHDDKTLVSDINCIVYVGDNVASPGSGGRSGSGADKKKGVSSQVAAFVAIGFLVLGAVVGAFGYRWYNNRQSSSVV